MERQDWARLYPRVVRRAAIMLKVLGEREVVLGETAQDIAARVIEKVVRGKGRRWRPEKCPELLHHLYGVVRSEVSNHFRDAPAREPALLFETADETPEEAMEREYDPDVDWLRRDASNLNAAWAERVVAGMLADAADSAPVALPLPKLIEHVLDHGVVPRRDIAGALGVDPSDVTNAWKRLHRVAVVVAERHADEEGGRHPPSASRTGGEA